MVEPKVNQDKNFNACINRGLKQTSPLKKTPLIMIFISWWWRGAGWQEMNICGHPSHQELGDGGRE
jgi:hypothetical protein